MPGLQVGDLLEWVGIRPPSLHVKSCSVYTWTVTHPSTKWDRRTATTV